MSNHPLHRKSHCDSLGGAVSRAVYDAPAPGALALGGSDPLPAQPAAVPRPAVAAWWAAYERAKRTLTGVQITYEEFTSHAEGLGHTEAPGFAEDLYLMAACRLGRPLAFQALEHHHIVRVKPVVQAIVRDASAVDDILQEVRKRLMGKPASRACYAGTGPLESWIRSMAVNAARDHLRMEDARRRREEAHAWMALAGQDAVTADDNVLLGIIWQDRASACLDAVRSVFRETQLCERCLLRDYYFRGLSIDALAPLHAVNRSTVARRLHKSTEKILRYLRRRIAPLYPLEDTLTLDSIALAACRALLADASSPLDE